MSKMDEKENLGVAARDFSVRWHLSVVVIIALSVLVAYFLASKLVLS